MISLFAEGSHSDVDFTWPGIVAMLFILIFLCCALAYKPENDQDPPLVRGKKG